LSGASAKYYFDKGNFSYPTNRGGAAISYCDDASASRMNSAKGSKKRRTDEGATVVWQRKHLHGRDGEARHDGIDDVYCASKLSKESKVPLAPPKEYSDRSGLPRFA
jgi:hypothetical protein